MSSSSYSICSLPSFFWPRSLLKKFPTRSFACSTFALMFAGADIGCPVELLSDSGIELRVESKAACRLVRPFDQRPVRPFSSESSACGGSCGIGSCGSSPFFFRVDFFFGGTAGCIGDSSMSSRRSCILLLSPLYTGFKGDIAKKAPFPSASVSPGTSVRCAGLTDVLLPFPYMFIKRSEMALLLFSVLPIGDSFTFFSSST